MARILIAEDEKPISDLIAMSLKNAGYLCECVFDGLAAADSIEKNPGRYDLVLLDIMLPEADGYELMDYIRPYDIPVIFLTAKSTIEDRVKGLRLGAEDYICKPFAIMELLARVETVLRRFHKNDTIIRLGELEIDTASHTVKKHGKEIPLTNKEYDLFLLFLSNKNIALFRDVIYEKIWGGEYTGESRTVDLHVQRIKKKLGLEDVIKTIYKVGYRLEV